MSIVCGLDLHRQQITFDAVETGSGEVWRGRVWQPDRERFRRWLCRDVARRAGGEPVAMAVEGCTGWRYAVEEIVAAGFEAHLAEPADTQGRGAASATPRRIVPTPGCCASCCSPGELPESWIPPADVLEWRERVRLYKSLVDQRRVWIQRIHAELFQHGVAVPEGAIRSAVTRDRLLSDEIGLTPAGRQRVRVGYRVLEATDVEAQSLKRDLQRFGYHQPACRALADATYGIGGLIAVAVWSELGDCRRFSRSEQVVRHSGLDVSVDQSDRHRAHGYLTRQGDRPRRFGAAALLIGRRRRRTSATPLQPARQPAGQLRAPSHGPHPTAL
jgi:transposase